MKAGRSTIASKNGITTFRGSRNEYRCVYSAPTDESRCAFAGQRERRLLCRIAATNAEQRSRSAMRSARNAVRSANRRLNQRHGVFARSVEQRSRLKRDSARNAARRQVSLQGLRQQRASARGFLRQRTQARRAELRLRLLGQELWLQRREFQKLR